jgi:hypothetical protein
MADWPKEFTVNLRICKPSSPCKHNVKVDGEYFMWDAVEIVAALQRTGQSVPPHFEYVLQNSYLAAQVQQLMNEERQW